LSTGDTLRQMSRAAIRQLELEIGFGVDMHRRNLEDYEMPSAEPARESEPGGQAEGLAGIAEEVAACRACGLSSSRRNVVPGAGNPDADIMFIGEAPGADEDAQGLPFVGRAGKMLTKMIQYMGLTREQVFIGNILKCRPPGNRDPQLDEIMHCIGFLQRQIEVIRPKVIVALGRIAAHTLLETNASLKSLRGQTHEYLGIPFIVTYHPAYLIRRNNPQENDKAKADLDTAKEFMNS